MKSNPQEPDRAFFESEWRSAVIRNVCLDLMEAADGVIQSEADDKASIESVLEANAQLAALGVEPDMHAMRSPSDTYRNNLMTTPVLAAEYLAGQLRRLSINTSGFIAIAGLTTQIEEHDELQGEGGELRILGEQDSPAKAMAGQFACLQMLKHMIDYRSGPSDLVAP